MKPTHLSRSTSGSRSGSTLFGVLTLVAVLCILALVAMQVMELLFYNNPPA